MVAAARLRRSDLPDVQRQAHAEATAFADTLAGGFYPAAVHLSQPAHQRKSYPETALIASSAALAAREDLEQLRKLLRRNTVAAVADRDERCVAVATRGDLDLPALVRVLRGVVEQVAEDLREPHRIGIQHQRLVR